MASAPQLLLAAARQQAATADSAAAAGGGGGVPEDIPQDVIDTMHREMEAQALVLMDDEAIDQEIRRFMRSISYSCTA